MSHVSRRTFHSRAGKVFEEKYTNLEVRSVWIIEKSRENDGFQIWHEDFYLGTEVTTTIVVNVGAVTKDLTFLRHQTKQHCNHQLNLILNNPSLII